MNWGRAPRHGRDLPSSGDRHRGELVNQAEVDAHDRPGTSTDDAQRLAELEHEVRELRRANAILRSASASSRRSSTAHKGDHRLHPPKRPVVKSPGSSGSLAEACERHPSPVRDGGLAITLPLQAERLSKDPIGIHRLQEIDEIEVRQDEVRLDRVDSFRDSSEH